MSQRIVGSRRASDWVAAVHGAVVAGGAEISSETVSRIWLRRSLDTIETLAAGSVRSGEVVLSTVASWKTGEHRGGGRRAVVTLGAEFTYGSVEGLSKGAIPSTLAVACGR
jgi:hypothetical protein